MNEIRTVDISPLRHSHNPSHNVFAEKDTLSKKISAHLALL